MKTHPSLRFPLITVLLVASAVLVFPIVGSAQSNDGPVSRPSDVASIAEDAILLRHKFTRGVKRRYRVESTTVESCGEVQCESPSIREQYRKNQEPARTNRIEFVEEETCENLAADGAATITYRCVSFRMRETQGDKRLFDLEVAQKTDLHKARGEPRALYLAGLMEKPVRYSIDGAMNIKDVAVPDAATGEVTKQFLDQYRKAIQARYRAFFPTQRVRPGDRWTGFIPYKDGMWSPAGGFPDVDYVVEARYVRNDRWKDIPCVVIELDVALRDVPKSAAVSNGLQSTFVKGFVGKSTVYFDAEDGKPLADDTTIEIAIDRVVGRRDTMKITFPLKTVQRIKSEIVDDDAQRPKGS